MTPPCLGRTGGVRFPGLASTREAQAPPQPGVAASAGAFVRRPILRRLAMQACCVAQAGAVVVPGPASAAPHAAPTWSLPARVIAVGLPGVAGVRQVGRFHFGGPIPANPEFLMHTQTGRVLDPERVLVAVSDNLGAPRAVVGHAPGAVLSIDAGARRSLIVPPDLAARGGAAAGGAIQLYTAQAPAYANARHNAGSRTATWTAASGPRYLSINNAFGRPWIANAPHGAAGSGSLSVVDPNGAPLAHAPSASAGGVFAGGLTPRETAPRAVRSGLRGSWFNHRRSEQFTSGALAAGALGTAFLGPSPDGSGFAVFAAATADGAIVQVHVQDGVDGLAPAGTIAAVAEGPADPGVIGMAFKWNPLPALLVTDALRNRLVVLHLAHDGRHFTLQRTRTITSPAFAAPVDLAPAVPEVANPRFASHTTLAGGADLYVANGDGTIVRIDESGRVRASARVVLPLEGQLGAGRIRAIAVAADAQRLWITLGGAAPGHPRLEGALIEVPAFDASGPFGPPSHDGPDAAQGVQAPGETPVAAADSARDSAGDLAAAGAALFAREFDAAAGLGPLFNARSCLECHSRPSAGGMSHDDAHFAVRVARLDPRSGRVTSLDHANSPVARRFVLRAGGGVAAQRVPTSESADFPRQANVVSLRMPPALYGVARLDEIADEVIQAHAVSKGDGIKGRVNRVRAADGSTRVGRYGWKAQTATLPEMVADAFADELGVVTAAPGQAATSADVEDDGRLVRAVTAYLRGLRMPAAAPSASTVNRRTGQ